MFSLDRCLVNQGCVDLFPEAIVHHLPRLSSDHNPLLLELYPCKASHFRFEALWLGYPDSWDIIRRAWRPKNSGSVFHKLAKCFSSARRALKLWNKETVRANPPERSCRLLKCRKWSSLLKLWVIQLGTNFILFTIPTRVSFCKWKIIGNSDLEWHRLVLVIPTRNFSILQVGEQRSKGWGQSDLVYRSYQEVESGHCKTKGF